MNFDVYLKTILMPCFGGLAFFSMFTTKNMNTQLNKLALVTGATKGMGLAISRMLAAEGFHLVLSARSYLDLDVLKNELENRHGVRVYPYVCDFLEYSELVRMVDEVMAIFKNLDVLVNNVGIYRQVSLLDESDSDFYDQWQVNFKTAYYLCKQIGKSMRARKSGHIFNISSIASREPVVAAGSYTITKFAVAGLTAVLRLELAPYGVKVTEVIPGSTLTASWDGEQVEKDTFILPEDVASAVRACLLMSKGAHVNEIIIKPAG
ncbi:hypothetical protein SAMN05216436_11535 [bacterium A37T11]|nr:hypothetical protein SAMN05216436_11535 [bacterium A37T11]